jgi:hypothetical protein
MVDFLQDEMVFHHRVDSHLCNIIHVVSVLQPLRSVRNIQLTSEHTHFSKGSAVAPSLSLTTCIED